MIAGVATLTIVESTRIMKKPRHNANSAGQGSFSSTGAVSALTWVTLGVNIRSGTMHSMTPQDLMAGPPPTHLPPDPAAEALSSGEAKADVVRRFPASPLAWSALAAEAADAGVDPVTVYAYARVGYHRSLDLLRRNGWKGHGPIPWEHEPNRGFLRCLAVLGKAAAIIDEKDEAERCATFLRDSSPTAADALS